MRCGLYLPNFGDFADARAVAAVAAAAEADGWDGVFLWDHIAPSWEPGLALPTVDVTVALTAIALATEDIRFGPLVTPLARRRPQKVAREMASLDVLSAGRVVLGVGLGHPADTEFDAFGDDGAARCRAERLDESLEIVTALWSGKPVDIDGRYRHAHTSGFLPVPTQSPRIPIWVAATWPGHPRPMRRAARWDGIVPISPDRSGQSFLTPEDVADIRGQLHHEEPFEIVVSTYHEADASAYEQAGATWLLVCTLSKDEALARAAEGPPTLR